MDAFTIGQIWGSIFIAGFPTAAWIYYWCAKRNRKGLALCGVVSCMISGLVGGLLFALPMVGIIMLIAKLTQSQVQDASTEAASGETPLDKQSVHGHDKSRYDQSA